MFNIEQATVAIRNKVEEHFVKGREEVLSELGSRGYEEIIKSLYISPGFEEANIVLQDNIIFDKRQDIIEVLAQGGALKKTDGSFITFKPARSVRKYLGKR